MSEKYQRADEALKYTSVSDDTMESLKYPKTSLKVSIPVVPEAKTKDYL